jgi:hypothetical protein
MPPLLVIPELDRESFTCPSCGVLSRQVWRAPQLAGIGAFDNLTCAECDHCHRFSYWRGAVMIWPQTSASAALLRLAIQKICIHLGQPGRKIDDDIGALVANGLPVTIQQALDVVRVIGNESVHPGVLDLRDDSETVGHLFDLVNLIVEDRISQPKRVQALYDRLPDEKKAAIARRDAPAQKRP